MQVKITHIDVDTQSVQPALGISIELEYTADIEAPVCIGGRLMCSGKVISYISEYQMHSDAYIGLRVFNAETSQAHVNSGSKFRSFYRPRLTALLSHQAVQFLDEARERHPEKSVDLYIEFLVKSMTLPFKLPPNGVIQNEVLFAEVLVTRPAEHFTIKQSDWVNKYTEYLGIGKFILVELNIPNTGVPKFWRSLYEKLVENLRSIEQCLKAGQWQEAMFYLRKYYENVKIGDDKPGHQKFRSEFDKLMRDDQHGEEGIKNLYHALWQLFEFMSKYVHDKDRQGNLNVLPIAYKEDAYLGYSLAVGLLNFIGRKLNRK